MRRRVADNQTPNVNFFLNFYGPNNSSYFYKEKRKYYSSNKAKDYINYIQTGIEEFKDYIEYANNREKSSGIFYIPNPKGTPFVIVHLSVAESILRRGFCGLILERLPGTPGPGGKAGIV